MAKTTIWVSRVQPWDFAFAGVQRYTLWFKKPYFKESVFECVVFGGIDPTNYQYAHWSGDHNSSVKLSSIKHFMPELYQKIWLDTIDCYVPVPDGAYNIYEYLLNKYDANLRLFRGDQHICGSEDFDVLAESARENEAYCIAAEAQIEIESMGWREHLLEYEIDGDYSPPPKHNTEHILN
jgi:hypothetical protein